MSILSKRDLEAFADPLENVCRSCAESKGSAPVSRPVGHWMATCDLCGYWRCVAAPRDYVPRVTR